MKHTPPTHASYADLLQVQATIEKLAKEINYHKGMVEDWASIEAIHSRFPDEEKLLLQLMRHGRKLLFASETQLVRCTSLAGCSHPS